MTAFISHFCIYTFLYMQFFLFHFLYYDISFSATCPNFLIFAILLTDFLKFPVVCHTVVFWLFQLHYFVQFSIFPTYSVILQKLKHQLRFTNVL